MALNKTYWEYSSAHSEDWSSYGIRYADKQIYANPNFSWGALDYSFPTSFRSGQKVTILHCGNDSRQQSAETLSDVIIYNAMINAPGSGARNCFYNDTEYSSYNSGDEGYYPVIDIDTHDFAYKMTVEVFTSGNWVTVNAVDFVNNYDNYAAGVYGYINNRMETIGNTYSFCNFYNAGNEQFSVKANYNGYRTSGYGNTGKGGHACSGQTAWSNRGIWQLASGTAAVYSNPSTPYNMCFPFEIPEINGQSWNCGNETAPAALMTGGVYTNHAVLTYSDQRVYVPLKHILRDIIVNCGLVLLDSNDDKWISMVDSNGLCQNKLVLMSSDEAKESSIYNTRTSDNNLNPTPTPPGPSGDDIDSMGFDGMSCNVGGPAKYYIMSYSDIHHLIGDFNAHAEPGTSISNNIISCYVNALDWNWSTGSEPIEIYSGGAQTTAFTSDINYDVLTGYNARDIIGSIDVPRMTNTFYDFSPYSTYEVYVPFCGWVALPDTVAGRHIKIYFETDEATCGCKGRVFFVDGSGNGVTVAEITGSFGAPCPIQVIEGGLYKQAMLSNGLQVIGGIASGVMGGAMGAGALAVSGLSSAMQSLGNCLIAGNTNYGQTIGRAGDASGLMCAGKPYLKITYPPVDEVVNNSRFGHTVGYLCNIVGKLSTFSGFTVCANPHITGINCTDSEKEELKRLLEEGVIL